MTTYYSPMYTPFLGAAGLQPWWPYQPYYPPVNPLPAWSPYFCPFTATYDFPPPISLMPIPRPPTYPFYHNGMLYCQPPASVKEAAPFLQTQPSIPVVEEQVVAVEKPNEEKVRVEDGSSFDDSNQTDMRPIDDPVYLDSIEGEEDEEIRAAAKLRWVDVVFPGWTSTSPREMYSTIALSACNSLTDDLFIQEFIPNLLKTTPTKGILKTAKADKERATKLKKVEDDAVAALEACFTRNAMFALPSDDGEVEAVKTSSSTTETLLVSLDIDEGYVSPSDTSSSMSPSPRSRKSRRKIFSGPKKVFHLPLERSSFLKELNQEPVVAAW
ncbi:hypothetical protein RvY_04241 [Ramazzottius varieornatus]|uniref:Uncharacterized protein n=1 Tax=Ramazzottius varieornatus TaxID=947166 RepID=A0A1D1V102_RAMVA|nr:hypothetical protein RvY_04241 [Ramazzottius varieornatus]